MGQMTSGFLLPLLTELAFTPNATTETAMTFLSSVFAHEEHSCTDNGPVPQREANVNYIGHPDSAD